MDAAWRGVTCVCGHIQVLIPNAVAAFRGFQSKRQHRHHQPNQLSCGESLACCFCLGDHRTITNISNLDLLTLPFMFVGRTTSSSSCTCFFFTSPFLLFHCLLFTHIDIKSCLHSIQLFLLCTSSALRFSCAVRSAHSAHIMLLINH